MKLLIISAAYPPLRSGGADFAMRMADEFAQRNIDVTVLTSTKATVQSQSHKLLALIKQWSWLDVFPIIQVVREQKPDVIDIHFTGWVYNNHPMVTFLPTILKSVSPAAHISVHIESLGGATRDSATIFDIIARRALSTFVGRDQINYEYGSLMRDCHSAIFLNERDRKALCEMFDRLAPKTTVLPPPPIMPVVPPLNASKATLLKEEIGLNGREIVLAYYGYLYPGKGVETLFSALQQCVQGNKRDAALLLIGGAPEASVLDERCHRPQYIDELKSLAASMQLQDRIAWIGFSPSGSDRPSRLLRISDICVLPFDRGVMLHNSSFAFAAGHGIPIISTSGPDTEDVFEDRRHALLVPPSDPIALANAIVNVFDDLALRTQLADGASAFAQDWFNWQKLLDATLSIWQKP